MSPASVKRKENHQLLLQYRKIAICIFKFHGNVFHFITFYYNVELSFRYNLMNCPARFICYSVTVMLTKLDGNSDAKNDNANITVLI